MKGYSQMLEEEEEKEKEEEEEEEEEEKEKKEEEGQSFQKTAGMDGSCNHSRSAWPVSRKGMPNVHSRIYSWELGVLPALPAGMRIQSFMKFSNLGPSHELQFIKNCSSRGPFYGTQSIKSRLPQHWSPIGHSFLQGISTSSSM
ncbi:hypothetical protein llap_13015 [Limosa lapponica baueri]|uniref:Uncharacterized protein n=1 Tax=Limosa lapponica baueri TaxID=1758121 RepID=A0A2I0TS83_LIMLA|nr:hypothetical protein llap_13015 [Limosa lapponica baueri]